MLMNKLSKTINRTSLTCELALNELYYDVIKLIFNEAHIDMHIRPKPKIVNILGG